MSGTDILDIAINTIMCVLFSTISYFKGYREGVLDGKSKKQKQKSKKYHLPIDFCEWYVI